MIAGSPFVGLRPFEANEAKWFFGRDQETSTLVGKLQTARFTAVVGPSGSGKSSLVRAGAIPFLRGKGWQAVIAKPGSAPISRLAQALAGIGSERRFVEARHFQFDTVLRASAFGLEKTIETLAVETPRVLLIIDQFEELFRYGDEASGIRKIGMREESRAFVELLLTGASRSDGRLHVCVTMRSDFFGACSSYAGLAEAVSASQFLVPMPVRHQLEQVIRTPIEKANARIDEALVQHLLIDVEEEQDKLPLLQHTLRRLWEHASGDPPNMQEGDYVTIGKIAGSIDRKAEAVRGAIGKANAADLMTLERIMKALTDLDVRGRATRRMQKRSELLALLQGPVFPEATAAEASLDRVLKPLAAEENSFVQSGDGEDPEVDICHEALIRSWTRLSGPRRDFESGWLREERQDGELWRGYVIRAEQGTLLSLRESINAANWPRRRLLGQEWSRRYGDRWKNVTAFIAKSRRRGVAVAGLSTICLVLIATAWWNESAIRWEIHKYVDIGPFMKSKFLSYRLDASAAESLKPLSTFLECARDVGTKSGRPLICPEMVVIPPGPFTMGSDSGLPNEQPAHSVQIKKRFAASKYEVTHEQWTTCVDHGWCRQVPDTGFGRYDRPVNNISWDDAQQYVDWLSQMTGNEYRLLSEAEWEYVARAGTETPYYWGNGKEVGVGNASCEQCGNASDNRETVPVGQFPPNEFGLYDTRGNVWEWTADPEHSNYYGTPPLDGSVWSDSDAGRQRVLRGGAYTSIPSNLTASYRFFAPPDARYPSSGLRIARTLVDAADKPK